MKIPKTLRQMLPRLARHFGYALIPIKEIERMETDAQRDYAAMREKPNQWTKGYFNGIADALSKTSAVFRRLYLP